MFVIIKTCQGDIRPLSSSLTSANISKTLLCGV